MVSLIGEWTGKVVCVALRLGGGFGATRDGMLEGKLLRVREEGVVLEMPKGQTFVPASAILHIILPEGR